jgi:hypothetical protein
MIKKLAWISDNILYLYTLFLLAFIPLYPKIPLLDLKNTWVYIRLDDFAIALGVLLLGIQLLRRKATLKTPLTINITLFWIIGLVATVWGIIFIFPQLVDVHSNLAILHYVRRIEYLSVFFIAYSAIRTKKQLYGVIAVLSLTLLAVVGYGLGQRYLGFPAYLTMNEEFAKGTPLRLSGLSRIPSTFAGHYDLAAYLVMIIAITASMVTAMKKYWLKLLFILLSISGIVVLLMTASRVSFAVYLVTITFLLIIQKKKLFIIPVVVGSIFFASTFEGISDRYMSTISTADVIVDARTGETIGIGKEVEENGETKIVIKEEQSTGENLPQGSGYVNVPNEGKRTEALVYREGKESEGATSLTGDFVVKKVLAYDVSLTTRLQGTWPRAFEAFKRNILLGSGYSSITLASDGNYIRILGEVGLAGFMAFIGIFLVYFVYVKKLLSDVNSRVAKHFILGTSAAIFGVALNAVLIDVFEASKVAYMLWMLMGISLATLFLYKKKDINIVQELKSVLTSPLAILIGLCLGSIFLNMNVLGNFFVADDFVWLRWAADCTLNSPNTGGQCLSVAQSFTQYFTDAQGFFYRPGTKIYFYVMYALFWLNSFGYHFVSVLLHAIITFVIYLLALQLLGRKFFALILAALFLTASAHYEALLWISVTGHLFAFLFSLLGILFFTYYQKSKNIFWLIPALLFVIMSPFFHEYGVVAPILVILFSLLSTKNSIKKTLRSIWYAYIPFLLVIPSYLYMRMSAQSAGFSGDYNYNLIKLPVNVVGNSIGYVMYQLFGMQSLGWYQTLRVSLKDNLLETSLVAVLILAIVSTFVYIFRKRFNGKSIKHVVLAIGFFGIAMSPFLGLGNIAERYIYFGSFGLILLFVLFLKMLFSVLEKNKYVAYGVVSTIVITVIGVNIVWMQSLQKEWLHAGTATKAAMNEFTYYAGYYAEEIDDDTVYYLVNTPKRINSAWVFPLGIEDMIWFTAQNKSITVTQGDGMQEAIEYRESYPNTRIFEFDNRGIIYPLIEEKEQDEEAI